MSINIISKKVNDILMDNMKLIEDEYNTLIKDFKKSLMTLIDNIEYDKVSVKLHDDCVVLIFNINETKYESKMKCYAHHFDIIKKLKIDEYIDYDIYVIDKYELGIEFDTDIVSRYIIAKALNDILK